MDALVESILKLISEQGLLGAGVVLGGVALKRGWVYLKREFDGMKEDRDFYRSKYFEQAATTRAGINTSRDLAGALSVIEDLADRIKP